MLRLDTSSTSYTMRLAARAGRGYRSTTSGSKWKLSLGLRGEDGSSSSRVLEARAAALR
jgi:hypothetical protein